MTLSEKKDLLRKVQKQRRAEKSDKTSDFSENTTPALLENAIKHLEKPKSREIMRLRYLEGYSAEAAAERMEMSVRQVIRISNAAAEELRL